MADISTQLQQTVLEAIEEQQPLNIEGSGSKAFLGHPVTGQTVSLTAHSGIIDYQPTELVITARAGTPLKEIETTLAEHDQFLPFQPPHYAEKATLGGTIATGLSGSTRPFTGSARDFMLGCKIINGRGQILQFGGQVMKNVAGYDVSRLMVGAMGSLGMLLEISLKVLPAFPEHCYLSQQRDEVDALRLMRLLASQNLPLTGLAYDGEQVHIRLAGANASVNAAKKRLGGETHPSDKFWSNINEHTHHFFDGNLPLWRLSVPPATEALTINGKQLIDWGGGLRWLKSELSAEQVFELAARFGGHAQLYRGNTLAQRWVQPLPPAMLAIQQKLKASFDPEHIFNPGRLYPEL